MCVCVCVCVCVCAVQTSKSQLYIYMTVGQQHLVLIHSAAYFSQTFPLVLTCSGSGRDWK